MTFPGESLAVYIVASNFSDISSTDKWQKEQIEITRFFPSTQAGTQVHAPFGDLVPSGETGNLIFQDWGYDRAPVNNYISWKTNEEIYLTGFNIFLTDDSNTWGDPYTAMRGLYWFTLSASKDSVNYDTLLSVDFRFQQFDGWNPI
jgi:hypothetical protein